MFYRYFYPFLLVVLTVSFEESFFPFFKDFICLFLERGEGKEKERERNISDVAAPHRPPTGDLAHNPGTCPDWESNQQPFGLQDHAQSTELHQLGRESFL